MADKTSNNPRRRKLVLDENQYKILSAELTEAFVTFRTILTLLTQALAALLAANVAYFGFALTTKKALVVIGGEVFPLIILAILNRVRKWLIPVIYSTLHIEKLSVGQEIGVGTNFVSFIQGQEYVDKLLSVDDKMELEARRVILRTMPLPLGDKGIARMICIFSAIGQLTLGLILWRYFQWSML